MKSLIKIKNLNFKYGNQSVLKNLDMNIEEGSFTAILGANGCGKTTLLKNILRLFEIKEQTIFLNGEDLKYLKREKIAATMAYVPQNERVNYHFKVRDFITLGRYSTHTSKFQDNKVIDEMIELTSLNSLSNKFIEEISGGEYQRTIIARALCQESKILLLDEPTSNLDPLHQNEIMGLLKNLVERENLSVICTLHDLNSALDYCSDTILLKNGEVYKNGKTETVINEKNLKDSYKINTLLVDNPFTNRKHIIIEP